MGLSKALSSEPAQSVAMPETEIFLGVLTGKLAFLLGHIARSLLLGLYGARGAPGRTMLIG